VLACHEPVTATTSTHELEEPKWPTWRIPANADELSDDVEQEMIKDAAR